MCKCSQRDCDLEVFENSDKCILHCEKDDWYRKLEYNNHKDWSMSKDKIDFFWNKFNNFIKKSTQDESLKCNFNDVVFPAMGYREYPKVAIFKLLSLKNCIFLDEIDLSFFLDAKSLEIDNCTFTEDVEAKEVIHKEQFMFQNNLVLKNIKFVNIEFKGTSSFMKNKFKKELTFQNMRFDDYALFNNSEIEDLFFRNTFFRKESNFLDIKLSKVGDRETARIIKDSFEKQNNIIESNKFYALEMKEREDELSPKKDFFEWIVFKTHGLVSNHSQDWVLVLFWIISLTFITSFIKIIDSNISQLTEKIVLSFIVTSIVFFININVSNTKKIYYIICSLVYYILYSAFTKDFALNIFSNTINPFSIMTGKEELTFGILLYKITIAYLIYQLIVSIRQNTRRK
ncbi:MAG: hypothetical protein WCR78_00735 [Arcobacteraceae bacterium]